MLPKIDVSALNLIKSEIDVSLTQIEGALSAFVEDNSNNGTLGDCAEAMEQVWGALRLINVHGASELSELMFALLRQINELQENTPERYFSALGNGMMVMNRYLEYVQIKAVSLPQLLLPSINECRKALGLPELGEGFFLDVPYLPAPPALMPLDLDSSRELQLAHRIRHMYQIGLLNLLRDQAEPVHYRLMGRALERAAQICAGNAQSLLWWVGQAVMEALSGGVELTDGRKRLLAQLEQQLRLLTLPGGSSQPVDTSVLANALAIVGLGESGEHVLEVQSAFELGASCIPQSQLRLQHDSMFGPGGSVIKTVAAVLKDEIAHIKDVLDIIARGSQQEEESYETVADEITKASQTLIMLSLNDVAGAMRRQADVVRHWQDVPAEGELNVLVDILLQADNAVAALDKEMTPGSQTVVNNARISIHQLDEARSMLVAESRAGMSLVKRAILSYIESQGDTLHLANVPATLQSTSGGLSFLMAERGAGILRSCAAFIDRLVNTKQMAPMSVIETFADAIACVDYYLESLEVNKPVSDNVFDIGEESVAELGFPVLNRQAA
ncbi:hypothetical protein EV700_2967 [Fluviicoccus keumensis]|uniref:Scaffold protein FimL second domain-containing protein n=1 Tax=Fluviicoccus keumensis TaxID=1435465 RepID=A0A4Q7YIW5_9GAMM|nr:hypothetical protein [Fluviicoccus keumensis]RZU37098.1 hypothetical protein EV700_2967 [Fluviicoccus keumensis]